MLFTHPNRVCTLTIYNSVKLTRILRYLCTKGLFDCKVLLILNRKKKNNSLISLFFYRVQACLPRVSTSKFVGSVKFVSKPRAKSWKSFEAIKSNCYGVNIQPGPYRPTHYTVCSFISLGLSCFPLAVVFIYLFIYLTCSVIL